MTNLGFFCSFLANAAVILASWQHHPCSAQTRTGIGLLRKPPAVKQFPTVESLIRASYAAQRKRRYEANKCG